MPPTMLKKLKWGFTYALNGTFPAALAWSLKTLKINTINTVDAGDSSH